MITFSFVEMDSGKVMMNVNGDFLIPKTFKQLPPVNLLCEEDSILGDVHYPAASDNRNSWYLILRDGELLRAHFWDQPVFIDYRSEEFKKLNISSDVHRQQFHLWNRLIRKAQPIKQVIL